MRLALEGLAEDEAVDAGEHQVEDRQVGLFGAGQRQRGRPIERLEDPIALFLQIEGDEFDDLPIVVHDQDRQSRPVARRARAHRPAPHMPYSCNILNSSGWV